MPSGLVTRRYSNARLVPLYPRAYNRRRPVNLAPNTTYPAGQWLGISGSTANAVQTLTTTGTPTGGSQTVTIQDPISGDTFTFLVPFDSTAAIAQANVRAAIGNSDIAVTGGAQPAAALVFTYSGRYAGKPVYAMTTDVTGLTGGTPAASFAQTTVGRTANTYGKYVGGSATDPAKAILEYACVTDGAGNVTYGGQTYTGEGGVEPSAPAWTGGIFRLGDTVGYDAGAIVDIGARFESGTISDVDAVIVIL